MKILQPNSAKHWCGALQSSMHFNQALQSSTSIEHFTQALHRALQSSTSIEHDRSKMRVPRLDRACARPLFNILLQNSSAVNDFIESVLNAETLVTTVVPHPPFFVLVVCCCACPCLYFFASTESEHFMSALHVSTHVSTSCEHFMRALHLSIQTLQSSTSIEYNNASTSIEHLNPACKHFNRATMRALQSSTSIEHACTSMCPP